MLVRVVEEVVRLADRRQRQQSPDHQTHRHQVVLRVNSQQSGHVRLDPEHGFQEERVHLGDLEEHADEGDLQHRFEGSEDVPVVHLPTIHHTAKKNSLVRRELLEEAAGAAVAVRNVAEVDPVVLASGEDAVDPHADAHSREIAAEDVHDHLVPPALLEVGEDVLRRDLQTLEPDRNDPQNAPVAEDERFPDPAEEVGEDEDVSEDVLDVLEVVRVLWNIDSAVRGVITVGQRRAQIGVEELHELAGIVRGERQNEQKETFVEDRDGKNDLPDHWMRPRNWTFLELQKSSGEHESTWFAPNTIMNKQTRITPERMLLT